MRFDNLTLSKETDEIMPELLLDEALDMVTHMFTVQAA
jgi:hypothetical protein